MLVCWLPRQSEPSRADARSVYTGWLLCGLDRIEQTQMHAVLAVQTRSNRADTNARGACCADSIESSRHKCTGDTHCADSIESSSHKCTGDTHCADSIESSSHKCTRDTHCADSIESNKLNTPIYLLATRERFRKNILFRICSLKESLHTHINARRTTGCTLRKHPFSAMCGDVHGIRR
jgi:hypothetical protein